MLHFWSELTWKASRVSNEVFIGPLAHMCREVLDYEDEMLVISVTGRNVGIFKSYLSAENKIYYFLC